PGGMGNRYPQRVDLLDQRRDQAGLARTGRGGNDIESTGGLAHGGYCPGLRRGGIIKATAGGVMPTWPERLAQRSSAGGGRPGLLLWRGILEAVDLAQSTERRRPATDHRQGGQGADQRRWHRPEPGGAHTAAEVAQLVRRTDE